MSMGVHLAAEKSETTPSQGNDTTTSTVTLPTPLDRRPHRAMSSLPSESGDGPFRVNQDHSDQSGSASPNSDVNSSQLGNTQQSFSELDESGSSESTVASEPGVAYLEPQNATQIENGAREQSTEPGEETEEAGRQSLGSNVVDRIMVEDLGRSNESANSDSHGGEGANNISIGNESSGDYGYLHPYLAKWTEREEKRCSKRFKGLARMDAE